jgi:hypothetical protein
MISVIHNQNAVSIKIAADVVNTSSQNFNLLALKRSIEEQLLNVYHASVGKYSLDFSINLKILTKVNECSPDKVLFQIVDTILGNNPAEADFKGLRIKLNRVYVNDIIENKNIRTIPHELGHLFGWDHPHARAQYASINLSAHLLEQQLTEEERRCNLMSQTWYAQKAGIPLERAMLLSEKQIDLLLLNDQKGLLNRNYHLKHFLFWKKIV